jgi:hypothetical protein
MHPKAVPAGKAAGKGWSSKAPALCKPMLRAALAAVHAVGAHVPPSTAAASSYSITPALLHTDILLSSPRPLCPPFRPAAHGRGAARRPPAGRASARWRSPAGARRRVAAVQPPASWAPGDHALQGAPHEGPAGVQRGIQVGDALGQLPGGHVLRHADQVGAWRLGRLGPGPRHLLLPRASAAAPAQQQARVASSHVG